MRAFLLALAKSRQSIYCSLCWMNRLQLSIGECLRDHEGTILVSLRSRSRYFSFMYFHVFFHKRSKKLLWLFCLLVFFMPDETEFSSMLRIKTIFFGRHSILREKKISASFQFWTGAYTGHIWRAWYNGSYTMMAKPIKTLELHYPKIQFLIILVMWVRRYPKHGDTQITLTAGVAIFNQETYETPKPLKPRSPWNHETFENKKGKKTGSSWNQGTYETTKLMKAGRPWNYETFETEKPMKPRNHWRPGNFYTKKDPWNQETHESRNLWNKQSYKNHESLELRTTLNLLFLPYSDCVTQSFWVARKIKIYK